MKKCRAYSGFMIFRIGIQTESVTPQSPFLGDSAGTKKSPSQNYAGYNLCTIVIITNPVNPVPLFKGEFKSFSYMYRFTNKKGIL